VLLAQLFIHFHDDLQRSRLLDVPSLHQYGQWPLNILKHVVTGLALAVAAAPPGQAATFPARTGAGGVIATVRVTPNRASRWNTITLRLDARGRALGPARITLTPSMPSMHMTVATFTLRETSTATYSYLGPALLMPGTWQLRFTLERTHKTPIAISVTDPVSA
jgi:hypothetical protein